MAKRSVRLPAKIELGYKTFTVQTFDPGPLGHLAGAINRFRDKIAINVDQPNGYEAVNTVIHECVHAIYWLSDLGKQDSEDNSEAEEERIVTAISNGFTELFRRNPDLVQWIVANLKEEDAS